MNTLKLKHEGDNETTDLLIKLQDLDLMIVQMKSAAGKERYDHLLSDNAYERIIKECEKVEKSITNSTVMFLFTDF